MILTDLYDGPYVTPFTHTPSDIYVDYWCLTSLSRTCTVFHRRACVWRAQRFQNSRTSQTWREQVRQICQEAGPNIRIRCLARLRYTKSADFLGPADFHSVRLYSTSAGPNVRHGFRSFRNLWEHHIWSTIDLWSVPPTFKHIQHMMLVEHLKRMQALERLYICPVTDFLSDCSVWQ